MTGGYYLTRGGDVAGPMVPSTKFPALPWEGCHKGVLRSWHADGKWVGTNLWENYCVDDNDLVRFVGTDPQFLDTPVSYEEISITHWEPI